MNRQSGSRAGRQHGRTSPQQVSWVGLMARITFVLFLLLMVYVLLVRPAASRYVGEQVNERLGLGATEQGQAERLLPSAVATLPRGEIQISAAQINAYLEANRGSLGPVEAATVRFGSGRAEADVRAYGLAGRAGFGLAAQEGRIVVSDVTLDGPLGVAVSARDLVEVIEQGLNAELANQNYRVRDLRIDQDSIIATIE